MARLTRRISDAYYWLLALLLWPLYAALHENYQSGRHTDQETNPMRLKSWRIKFEPRDLWVGVYWNRPPAAPLRAFHERRALDVYICPLPTLLLELHFEEIRYVGLSLR